MRLYSVYQSPEARGDQDLIFIKDGFCWPALVLPFIWPAWRGLWLVALSVVVLADCGDGGGAGRMARAADGERHRGRRSR